MGIFSAAIASFSKSGVAEPKSTILVIDDDPVLLQTVKSLLGKRGFNVVTSSSGPITVCRSPMGTRRSSS